MKSPRQVLNNNYQCLENSFIYYIHEACMFDCNSFWDYYNSIKELSYDSLKHGIDSIVATEIVHTYSYIVSSFMYHFAPNDSYAIKDFPNEDYNLYIERLKLTVEGYFNGNIIDEMSFNDELTNPVYNKSELKVIKTVD